MDITPQEWRTVLDINLNSVFYVAQQSARRMLAQGGGVIVNMGSSNGLMGYHYYADYNASKAGVIELSRSMALELAPTIRVNAVCPGFIMTPMQEAEYTPEMRRAFENKLPLNKLGKPEDVAALFAFLASDDAGFITGQYLVIDGGELISCHPRIEGSYLSSIDKSHYWGLYKHAKPSHPPAEEVEIRDLAVYQNLLEGGAL